jgi:hypothetical protein
LTSGARRSDRASLAPGRLGHTELVLTAAAGSYRPPTTILPANVPNSILLGAADSLCGIKVAYGPISFCTSRSWGTLKTMLLVWLVCRLCPEPAPLMVTRARPGTADLLWPTVVALPRISAVTSPGKCPYLAHELAHGAAASVVSAPASEEQE